MLDSHLHVWGDGKGSFPYASGQEPPERLRDSSGPDTLLQEMDKAGVGGALIVQVRMQESSCPSCRNPLREHISSTKRMQHRSIRACGRRLTQQFSGCVFFPAGANLVSVCFFRLPFVLHAAHQLQV